MTKRKKATAAPVTPALPKNTTPFEIGDTVMLKAGSPEMSVSRVAGPVVEAMYWMQATGVNTFAAHHAVFKLVKKTK